MNGVITGIGVGPGDPELITIKAQKAIAQADILYLPKKDRDKCRAYNIAKQTVPGIEEKEIVTCDLDMGKTLGERKDDRRKIYESVKREVIAGKRVAFLTIGDPAIYSTFSYIADLAAEDGIICSTVSGVSSISAAASAAGCDLCQGDEELHIVNSMSDIGRILDYPGTKVIMKCKDLAPLKEALDKRTDDSLKVSLIYAVSGCGTDNEKCYCGIGEIPDEVPYLTTVIIKEEDPKLQDI